MFGVWDDSPSLDTGQLALNLGAEFIIVQVEGPADEAKNCIQAIRDLSSTIPVGIVTNFNASRTDPTFDPLMHELNVSCLPECYLPDNPSLQPANLIKEAKERGYKTIVPSLGVYKNYPLSGYPISTLQGFCVYLEEEMQPSDWSIIF